MADDVPSFQGFQPFLGALDDDIDSMSPNRSCGIGGNTSSGISSSDDVDDIAPAPHVSQAAVLTGPDRGWCVMRRTTGTPGGKHLLTLIADLGQTTTEMLARWSGLPTRTVEDELQALQGAGLIATDMPRPRLRVWWITEAGAALLKRQRRGKNDLNRTSLRHTLAMNEVALAWRDDGWDVRLEPRIVDEYETPVEPARWNRHSKRFESAKHAHAKARRDYIRRLPDLVVAKSGQNVCIEVELTAKRPALIEWKLIDYRQWQQWRWYERVIYLTDQEQVARLVARSVAVTGTGDFISVHLISLPDYLNGWRPYF